MKRLSKFNAWVLAKLLVFMLSAADKKDLMLEVDKHMDRIWGEKESEKLQDRLCDLFDAWKEELRRDR